MIALALAIVAAYGVFLLYTRLAFDWSGLGLGPRVRAHRRRHRLQDWLTQAGLEEVRPLEVGGVALVLSIVGSALAFAVFGGIVPAVAAGGCMATLPLASARGRRARRHVEAREAWPRLIEEIRVLTVSAGRSIPRPCSRPARRAPPSSGRPSLRPSESG